jgi:hypothetical protein
VFREPLPVEEAIGLVDSWLAQPPVIIAAPTERHWLLLTELAAGGQARGPLLMDAHLAALAAEHGATLCTTDRDFTRFPGVRVKDPLASASPS